MKARLSKEEKEVLESFEKGDWIPVSDLPKRKKELAEYARNTLRKDKRLNIRISERDLLELQRKAVREGLPYQTYVSSIIHKFVNGTLVEAKKTANEQLHLTRKIIGMVSLRLYHPLPVPPRR